MTLMPLLVTPSSSNPGGQDAPWWWRRADWLYGSLLSGSLSHHGKDAEEKHPVELSDIDTLTFADGGLVIGDPYLLWGEDAEPILQRLQPTSYEVVAARAVVGPDHRRNAGALLVGAAGEVVSWDMARWSDPDLTGLNGEEMYGYGVDAGTGCFASTSAAPTMIRVLADDEGMLGDPLSQVFESGTSGGAGVRAPEAGAEPVAVFESGWGDGFYPTWLGSDAAGEIILVLTDFMLTADPSQANH